MLLVGLGEELVLVHQQEQMGLDLNSLKEWELLLAGENQELKELMRELRDLKQLMQRQQSQETILFSRLSLKKD